MEAGELELFARSVRAAAEAHRGSDLDTALVELGWPDALGHDPRAAVGVVFEQLGAVPSSSSALDDVLRSAVGASDPGVAVVLPPVGGDEVPAEERAGQLSIGGLGTARLRHAELALVAVRTPGGLRVAVVETAGLARRPVAGLDPELGLVQVAGTATALPRPAADGAGNWTDALSSGRRALAHELVGASTAMLDLARVHALERVQFGRPIAAFQAVRHRLADAAVALESARALLDAAWLVGDAETAAMAKAVAGRSARTVARHAQQVLAGMGFTTEHPLHRYVRRILVLDELLGSARSLATALGRDVLARRRLPPPLPL